MILMICVHVNHAMNTGTQVVMIVMIDYEKKS
jgi:hypothetical protein